jgi:hypothetical protein
MADMAPSRLEISDHAEERLKQRGITRQQVRNCLNLGATVGIDLRGRKICQKRIGSRLLIVIYIEVVGGQCVITAYWKGEV